jgi:hypothetical protein
MNDGNSLVLALNYTIRKATTWFDVVLFDKINLRYTAV